MPVAVHLREEAFAKTKRPYRLLDLWGADVAGGAGLGVLVTRTSMSALESMRSGFLQRDTDKDLWEISTIERVHAWRPLVEAVGANEESAGRARLDRIARESEYLSLELFPWLSAEFPIEPGMSFAEFLHLVGLDVVAESQVKGRPSLYLRPSGDFAGVSLQNVLGIRAVYPTPRYETTSVAYVGGAGNPPLPSPAADLPVVGVLDSGTAPCVSRWIAGRATYDPPHEQDARHGTFVAGLVAASRHLNASDQKFPPDAALTFDAQVLPAGPIAQHELEARIGEVVEDNSDAVVVWNCSFAALQPHAQGTYSSFAAFLDELSERLNVVFVQAAGNYTGAPTRGWPPQVGLADGLASPAEAVRSVTVGSLAHLDGSCVPTGSPASYSRRGPGVAGLLKPDVCFWSGDVDGRGGRNATGVASIDPAGQRVRDVGTSFATPIVAAISGNLMASISAPDLSACDRPTLVKALLTHSARMGPLQIDDEHRVYYGHGVPADATATLSDSEDSFTTLYRLTFTTAGEWIKGSVAIPACLISKGKLRAEVFMTVSHSAIVDPAFDDECVRTSVQASLGPQSVGKRGRLNVKGMVPPEDALQGWETEQIEGGKWSPVRSHRNWWPRGTEVREPWGIKVSLLERRESIGRPVDVVVLVTFRGLEPDLPVRSDGVRALVANSHATQDVVARTRLRVGGGGATSG